MSWTRVIKRKLLASFVVDFIRAQSKRNWISDYSPAVLANRGRKRGYEMSIETTSNGIILMLDVCGEAR